jgi:ParB family chromosome partitioning protein
LTLVVTDMFVREIWVEGRAPLIAIHDYDWGDTDPDPAFDDEGFAFSPINWRGPAWTLGLSLHPPAKETFTMANQKLKTIPLADLKVSKLNMRHGRKKPDISDILPSIRKHGLRQTLLVRQEGKHYGVVAGRRRLFALKQIAKETGIAPNVPCVVMQAGDDAAAIEASIVENAARLPATEMEQYVAFGKLADKGRAPADIAEYFGVTELTVRRVLALANLSEPIRTLYANDQLDRETIRALTLATPDQQTEWLRLYESEDERAPRGRQCRAWITGGHTITTDKALFDTADYQGQIIADLFGEQGVFADASDFWAAQSAAIADHVKCFTEAGWKDVIVMERGHYFQSWDHQKRARTKGGKVFVEIRHDGAVTFHDGFVTQADARKLEKASSGEDQSSAQAKPEMSGPMAEYILRHRHKAASASLLKTPAIALRLMVAHALVGSALWDVRGSDRPARKPATEESLAGSAAEAELEIARNRRADLFKALGLGEVRRNGDSYGLVSVFTALLALDDEELGEVLALAMAETLEPGGPVVEAVLHVCVTDLSAYWQPDDAFFDLLRDKRVINAMVAEIASPDAAKACLTETGNAQKEIIINRITGNGCKANSDWRSGWMQVPPSRILAGAASPSVDAWEKVARLFESDPEEAVPSDVRTRNAA